MKDVEAAEARAVRRALEFLGEALREELSAVGAEHDVVASRDGQHRGAWVGANKIGAGANSSTIAGGFGNEIAASAGSSTIGGGLAAVVSVEAGRLRVSNLSGLYGTIHMNEKDVAPPAHTLYGYSRGRWEGTTLVVETDHIAAGYFDHEGTYQGDYPKVELPDGTLNRILSRMARGLYYAQHGQIFPLDHSLRVLRHPTASL